jgi:benzylsuccinate CoA-transferase BbsF subunit
MAELGADVILVETPIVKNVGASSANADATAFQAPGDYTRDVYGILCHWNKRSIVIDLRTEGGQDLFRRLATKSDVVLENYGGPRVMTKFGLNYERLREASPAVIYLGMPAHGMTGPRANHTGYGLSLEQLAGYPAMTGYEGDESVEKSGINYTDPVAAVHAAAAILLALIYRKRTGRGQLIDLSQRESGINLIGETILDWAMNRRAPERFGDHDPAMSPHNVYRCTGGDDPWVFIACRNDAEWAALAREMGQPALAEDSRFVSIVDRKRNEGALDALIGGWTADQAPKAVEARLQAIGVPAGAVQDVAQTPRDPHAVERGLYRWVAHPNGIDYPLSTAAWLFAGRERPSIRVAPVKGADYRDVLGGVLGMGDGEIEGLVAAGVVGRP